MALDLTEYRPVVSGRCGSAAEAFADLSAGDCRLGMTGGQWCVLDAVRALLPCDQLALFSWRFSRIDVRELLDEVGAGRVGSLRLIISDSARGTEPLEFQQVVDLVSVDRLRVLRSHVKGFVATGALGGAIDAVYLTSANFNRNPRVENFELFAGGPMPAHYLGLADAAFAGQAPAAWEKVKEPGRKLLRKILANLRLAVPVSADVAESRADKARRKAGTFAGAPPPTVVDLDADPEPGSDGAVTLPQLVAAIRRTVERRTFGRTIRRATSLPPLSEILADENAKIRPAKIDKADS